MSKREDKPCKQYIYYLVDPTTREIRYVGYTKNIMHRYRGHLRGSCDIRKVDWDSHKCCWIRSLIGQNLKPMFVIVCIVQTHEEAQRIEIALIASLRQRNVQLTNGTIGGDGGSQGQEARIKMRLAKLGKKRKQEHIDAAREAHRIGANRRFQDPEQRIKQAAITRAQWANPESRAKKIAAIREAHLRRPLEQRQESGRKGGLVSQMKRRLKNQGVM